MSRDGPAARPNDGDELRLFLDRIRSGDDDAARELLGRYEAEVRLVVRRQLPRLLRSRFDSLDFLQSVWGSFFRRMRGGDGPADFEDSRHLVAFLARAAKNKVIDEYRRAGSQKQDMRREEPLWVDGQRPREVAGHEDSPSEVAQAHEALARMRDLLPEERREILVLKAEGLSSREIADRKGISERTVQRVIEDLRRRLDLDSRPGVVPEGAELPSSGAPEEPDGRSPDRRDE
ncbi:RNA polymerase sigma factor [Tautonia sociabilis]|uniref:Sigma-70 family RNA polymerase sigma factor n=1 Tax=Tautonia sociabilis TaxID=2080755 RepID=A0A432MNW1_9BACT|nr:sigma-70 family RNA polymerase sigma factor [Tautonia sociabilis]RUL88785.1 sigma-70 family RNA polymerase sigma factor [Tautonia sociabilis]